MVNNALYSGEIPTFRFEYIFTGSVVYPVLLRKFDTIRSSNDSENAISPPVKIPGSIIGQMMCMNVYIWFAPRSSEASSIETS